MNELPISEIEKRRAIPHGTLCLFLALLPPILVELLLARMWYQTTDFSAKHTSIILPLFATLIPFLGLCYFLTPILLPRPAGRTDPIGVVVWLQTYWKRNVIGETLWLCVEKRECEPMDSPEENLVRHFFTGKFDGPPASVNSTRALRIPLGGWFRGDEQALFSLGWTFGHGNSWKNSHSWKVSGTRLHNGYFDVRLEDGDKQSLWIDPLSFINIVAFRWSVLIGKTYSPLNWSCLLTWSEMSLDEGKMHCQQLRKCLRETKTELELSRSELENVRSSAWFELVETKAALLRAFIARLDGTKRFIKSKQAQAIRQWAIDTAIETLPPKYPLREQYEQKEPAPTEAETGT